jgi:hypothetical protein
MIGVYGYQAPAVHIVKIRSNKMLMSVSILTIKASTDPTEITAHTCQMG